MDLHETNDQDVKIYKKSSKIDPKADRVKWKNSNFINSFEFAWSGIRTAVAEERNMRKHLVAAGVTVLTGLLFRVSAVEWLFLLFAIFGVVILELLNSSIENVVDLASDYHFFMRAKKAKDMAAGAVLLMFFLAILVGLIIFVPKVWALLFL